MPPSTAHKASRFDFTDAVDGQAAGGRETVVSWPRMICIGFMRVYSRVLPPSLPSCTAVVVVLCFFTPRRRCAW